MLLVQSWVTTGSLLIVTLTEPLCGYGLNAFILSMCSFCLQLALATLPTQCLTARQHSPLDSQRTLCSLPPCHSQAVHLRKPTSWRSRHTTRIMSHHHPRLDNVPRHHILSHFKCATIFSNQAGLETCNLSQDDICFLAA